MQTRTVDVPEEILDLLHGSRLGKRSMSDEVNSALAIHLFLEGLVSVGKAAELARLSRIEFEALLIDLGLPTVRYDRADLEQNLQGIAEAERRSKAS